MDRPVRQGGERLSFGYGIGGHQRTVVVVEIDLLLGDRAAAAARLDAADSPGHARYRNRTRSSGLAADGVRDAGQRCVLDEIVRHQKLTSSALVRATAAHVPPTTRANLPLSAAVTSGTPSPASPLGPAAPAGPCSPLGP